MFENERGVFRVTLYNNNSCRAFEMSDEEQEILDFCKTPRSRSEVSPLNGFPYTR